MKQVEEYIILEILEYSTIKYHNQWQTVLLFLTFDTKYPEIIEKEFLRKLGLASCSLMLFYSVFLGTEPIIADLNRAK